MCLRYLLSVGNKKKLANALVSWQSDYIIGVQHIAAIFEQNTQRKLPSLNIKLKQQTWEMLKMISEKDANVYRDTVNQMDAAP